MNNRRHQKLKAFRLMRNYYAINYINEFTYRIISGENTIDEAVKWFNNQIVNMVERFTR